MKVLSTQQHAALQMSRVRLAYLLECHFPTGIVRFTTGSETIDFLGVEWLGAGAMLDIKFPDEDASLAVNNAEVTLNGLDVALISMALREPLLNATCVLYVALFGVDNRQPWGPPFRYMRGTLSHLRIVPPSATPSQSEQG